MNVRLTKEQKIKVLNSGGVYQIMQQVLMRENQLRRNQEHFWVVGLNNANKIEFIELITLGASNRVNVDPPDVFRMAIYKLTDRVILVHNHPSGNLYPSQADKDFTDKLLKVGKLIRIDVIDHLIISEDDYYGFEDNNIMEELRNSGLFEVVARDKAELENWKQEMDLERAVLDNKLEIAKTMKDNGVDAETIIKYTGLTDLDLKEL